MALGSFFHYAGGFTKPEAFDLTLPEVNIVGKLKDVLFPQPRLDFFAVVQARKRKDSPHGRDSSDAESNEDSNGRTSNPIEGEKYRPKLVKAEYGKYEKLSPYY